MVAFEAEIRAAALRASLNPILVMGLVSVESGFNPYAWNPEPRYRYFWDVKRNKPFRQLAEDEVRSKVPPPDFPSLVGDPDQEWWAQSASWGLMQIMGAVARELGFKGPYLSQLCDPDTVLDLGCQQLGSLVNWAKGDVVQALAAYNGGKGGNSTRPFRNQHYADLVLAARDRFSLIV